METITKAPSLKTAREMNLKLRNNMYEVVWKVLPGASDEIKETLIPGTHGSNKFGLSIDSDWTNTILCDDLRLHDVFMDWSTERFEEKGEAEIKMYTVEGFLYRTYTLKDITIKSVDSLSLAWDQNDQIPQFIVWFTVGSVERSEVVPGSK